MEFIVKDLAAVYTISLLHYCKLYIKMILLIFIYQILQIFNHIYLTRDHALLPFDFKNKLKFLFLCLKLYLLDLSDVALPLHINII